MKIPRILSLPIFFLGCFLLTSCPLLFNPSSEPGPVTDKLIFKLVNQWGIRGGREGWENIPDGALWITADAMKAENAVVMFFDNLVNYDPILLATFRIKHSRRADLRIKFYLGDPNTQLYGESKTFLPSEIYSGGGGYSDETIALDLSEWIEKLQSKNLYLSVWDDGAQSASGKISSFQLEVYADYGQAPIEIINTDTTLPLSTVNNSSVQAIINTVDHLGVIQTAAPASRSIKSIRSLFSTRPIDNDEYLELRAKVGVKEEGRNYNNIISGHGTGLAPPSEAEWEDIRKSGMVVKRETGSRAIKTLPTLVDLSDDPAFPPIGDQGQFGSCAAFATTYYIKTYMEAKERGWDLSDASSDLLTHIMSPKFVFELANDGHTSGIYASSAIRIITEIGCTSWHTLPYDATYNGSILAENIWREAPFYRGRVPNYSEHNCYYQMYVDTDEDIEILKELLVAGIPIFIGVDGNKYSSLDSQDIWDVDNYHDVSDNHGNTIVGYKMPTTP